MTALSVNSSFPDADWDRRLDTMLADLEQGTNGTMQQFQQSFGSSQQQSYSSTQQQSFSYTSSSQQASSKGVQQKQQQQAVVSQQQSHKQTVSPKYIGFSLTKSASTASLPDSAGGVLKDLEDGLVKSSQYIQESHSKYSGPDGTREWHEVKQGGPDPGEFNLEQQVQHMIPSITPGSNSKYSSHQQQQQLKQQQQQQFTAYKVQSNQYTGAGERVQAPEDDEDRPGSRLKQNIDELDTLLYDLNHVRNLSPDGGTDYHVSSENFGLDSDDYSETVGKEGHVKRTVHAFNEYSTHMSSSDAAKKPPSPSPRRKAPTSPPTGRRGPPTSQVRTQTTSQSVRVQQTTNQQELTSPYQQEPAHPYQPAPGPPGSGQPFAYTTESPPPPLGRDSPDLLQPNYYTKYNSVRQQTSKSSQDLKSAPFPQQSPRSPTPQSPPKKIEELLSEFQEFDSVHKGGSPTPNMFYKPGNSTVEVTELPNEPLSSARLEPVVREDPPRPKPVSPKGPEVYYPPGAEFSKAESKSKPVADGGSMSLHGGGQAKAKGKEKYKSEEEDGKQGAVLIPICLPLCCAAPCVIL